MNKQNKKPQYTTSKPAVRVGKEWGLNTLVSCLQPKDRTEKHQTSAGGARWDRGTQGCRGSHGDAIQGQFSNYKLLIYFFHARCILITLKRRDLIRNCSTGFLCCHFIFIDT